MRYEFDGFQPVAMTGGSTGHSAIGINLQTALRTRLRGSGCRPLGPDAGIEMVNNNAVRYPDALVTRSKFDLAHRTLSLERLNGEIKRRADVVGIFQNEAANSRLVGAILLEQNDEWVVRRRYMSLETLGSMSDTAVAA